MTLKSLALFAGQPGGNGNADGAGNLARFYDPRGITLDNAGNAYVGDSANHTIRKIALSTGAVVTLAGAADGGEGNIDGTGAAAVFGLPEGIVWDGNGNLYVADFDEETIRKIAIASASVTTIAGVAGKSGGLDGASDVATFAGPFGLTYDGVSTLYVAEFGGNRIRSVNLATSTVATVAGTGTPSEVNGPGTSATFDNPAGLGLLLGNLYVADDVNNVVREVGTVSPFTTSTFAGSGTGGDLDGTGLAAEFDKPHGLTSDGVGNLYVADWNETVRQVTVPGAVVTTVAGAAFDAGSADGTGAAARFNGPGSLTYSNGDLFVADTFGQTVRKVVPNGVPMGGVVSTVAGLANASGSEDASSGPNASFDAPRGLAYDGKSTIYVADSENETIRAINLITTAVTTLAGVVNDGGVNDGPLAQATFDTPWGLAYDAVDAGYLYVSDLAANTIRKIDLGAGMVSTVAGNGLNATFSSPRGLALDGAGNLYVADWGENEIRQIQLSTGTTTVLAGSKSSGHANGTGAAASFSGPSALLYDRAGNLYVSDSQNATIRKVTLPGGVVTTIAGTAGTVGAPPYFNEPEDLAYDGKGNLYVACPGDGTVRLVDVFTGATSTILGVPWVAGLDVASLPGIFNAPHGLVLIPGVELLISDTAENVIVKVTGS